MSAMPEVKPATGTATVTVACKIQTGFRCTIHEPKKFNEVTKNGTAETTQWFPTDKEFFLNGSAHAQNEGPRVLTVAGSAITTGVPKALWDEWYAQNRDLPAVKNGLIYSLGSTEKTVDAAKDRVAVKTGLERLNPHALPNIDPRFKVVTAEDSPVQIGNVEAA